MERLSRAGPPAFFNIQSVDVVHHAPDGTVIDDIVVTLPSAKLPDSLITAAQQLPGVEVDSIRPFTGTVDRRGQIEMLAAVASHRRDVRRAMEELVAVIPRTMTSGWGIVLDVADGSSRIAASPAAPADDGSSPAIELDGACVLTPEHDPWVPPGWAMLDSALAATPIDGTSLVLVIGRPGGPDFLASEVEHLSDVGTIIGSILN